MNSKFLRVLIVLTQTLVFAICIGVCVYSTVIQQETENNFRYITTVVRVVALVLLTASYYKSNVTSTNPGNQFTIMYMFLATIAELQIMSYFSHLTGWSILPPRVSVRVNLFAHLMMPVSIIGYAIHYQNNEYTAMSRFMLFSLLGTLSMSVFLPAPQDVFTLWQMSAPRILFTILSAVAIFSSIMLASSESVGAGTALREVATVMMVLGTYLVAVLGKGAYIIIGTALFSLGALVLMIMSLRNSILL